MQAAAAMGEAQSGAWRRLPWLAVLPCALLIAAVAPAIIGGAAGRAAPHCHCGCLPVGWQLPPLLPPQPPSGSCGERTACTCASGLRAPSCPNLSRCRRTCLAMRLPAPAHAMARAHSRCIAIPPLSAGGPWRHHYELARSYIQDRIEGGAPTTEQVCRRFQSYGKRQRRRVTARPSGGVVFHATAICRRPRPAPAAWPAAGGAVAHIRSFRAASGCASRCRRAGAGAAPAPFSCLPVCPRPALPRRCLPLSARPGDAIRSQCMRSHVHAAACLQCCQRLTSRARWALPLLQAAGELAGIQKELEELRSRLQRGVEELEAAHVRLGSSGGPALDVPCMHHA